MIQMTRKLRALIAVIVVAFVAMEAVGKPVPVAIPDQKLPSKVAPKARRKTTPTRRCSTLLLRKKSIVIVQEDPTISRPILNFLKKEGVEWVLFDSTNEAVDQLGDAPLGVFLDLDLPEADVIDFAKAVHASNRKIPIIAITKSTGKDREVIRTLVINGLFSLMEKPITPEVFREVLIAAAGKKAADEKRLLQIVGNKLFERRKELGLKQPTVATRTGFSIATISQIENGKTAAPLLTLLKLCQALDLTLEYLMDGF